MTDLDDTILQNTKADIPYQRSYVSVAGCFIGKDGEREALAEAVTPGFKIELQTALSFFRNQIADTLNLVIPQLKPLLEDLNTLSIKITDLSKHLEGEGKGYGRKLITELSNAAFLEGMALLEKELKEIIENPVRTARRIEVCHSSPSENPAPAIQSAANLVEAGALFVLEKLNNRPKRIEFKEEAPTKYDSWRLDFQTRLTEGLDLKIGVEEQDKKKISYEEFKQAMISDSTILDTEILPLLQKIVNGLPECRRFVELVQGLNKIGDEVYRFRLGRGEESALRLTLSAQHDRLLSRRADAEKHLTQVG